MSDHKQRKRGPMGGMAPVEKPKDFRTAIKKTMKYVGRYLPAIIAAFALAIGGVLCTLNVPQILGRATDEIILGVSKAAAYDAVQPAAEALGGGFATIGDVTEALEAAGYDTGSLNLIPDSYRADIMATGMASRPGVDTGAVLEILITLGVLVAISTVLNYLQGFILAGVAQKVSYHFRRDIEAKINQLPLKYYDHTTHGEVLSFLTNDVDTISVTLNQSLSQILSAVVLFAGVLVIMFTISGWLTLVALVLLPISFAIISLVVKKSQRHFKAQQDNLGHVNGHIEEMYGGHTVVTLNNGEERSKKDFERINGELYKAAWKSQFLSGLMQPVMMFTGNAGYVGVCVLGGFLAVSGQISVGNVQAFMQYIRQFNQPITQFATIMNTLQSTAAAAERVFAFLEEDVEKETGTIEPEAVKGSVGFHNVHFGYSQGHTIINDFTLDVQPGERVAIVGPTGAGKTTIVKLLMRYYGLSGGSIELDGVDIRDYTKEGLRRNIGMVLQDTWLFSGTIEDNIRYGRLDATAEEVREAAKTACADKFIRTLPGGYQFVINEEQENISQGQKQLLTIARVVIADPALLILDEATSSVDTRTELLIQKAMNRLMRGRTSFIIAHRLSTIRDADKILVLKDGDIVETGRHEELLEKDGFYATLYKSQFESGEAV